MTSCGYCYYENPHFAKAGEISSKFCNTLGLNSTSISSLPKISLKNISLLLSLSLLCVPFKMQSL